MHFDNICSRHFMFLPLDTYLQGDQMVTDSGFNVTYEIKGSGTVMTRLYKDWCFKLELFCFVLTLQNLNTVQRPRYRPPNPWIGPTGLNIGLPKQMRTLWTHGFTDPHFCSHTQVKTWEFWFCGLTCNSVLLICINTCTIDWCKGCYILLLSTSHNYTTNYL